MKQAVVVGAGPNGLAAAITLAQSGWQVRIHERSATVGGGCRSAELTLPGFWHDICSAIHPLALASPVFQSLDLSRFGLRWIEPPVALAHPFDDGTAATLCRSVDETAQSLGSDGAAYRRLMAPLLADFDGILPILLGPIRPPRHPIALARFGLQALRSLDNLVRHHFDDRYARALLGGMAAHAMIPLDKPGTASFGLVLALTGHRFGWPIPAGGSQALTDAIVEAMRSLPISLETSSPVTNLKDIGDADAVLFDTSVRAVASMAEDELSERYRTRLGRYRYGPGVFKLDLALSGPVQWTAAIANQAGTVHVGGRLEEIMQAEAAVHLGRTPEKPFVLVAQPSRFDPARAPDGNHTLWAYCHVPSGSDVDLTDAIEAQIERFAPGFRSLIIGRSTMTAVEIEQYNPNYVGGDINGGVQDLRQLFTRPTINAFDPYSTGNDRLYVCSSATPPGGGVHGMCGYHAARSVLRRLGTD